MIPEWGWAVLVGVAWVAVLWLWARLRSMRRQEQRARARWMREIDALAKAARAIAEKRGEWEDR